MPNGIFHNSFSVVGTKTTKHSFDETNCDNSVDVIQYENNEYLIHFRNCSFHRKRQIGNFTLNFVFLVFSISSHIFFSQWVIYAEYFIVYHNFLINNFIHPIFQDNFSIFHLFKDPESLQEVENQLNFEWYTSFYICIQYKIFSCVPYFRT